MVGNSSLNKLVSVSSDGFLCTWQLDMLAQPQVLKNSDCL
jgi:dynein intermediate chain